MSKKKTVFFASKAALWEDSDPEKTGLATLSGLIHFQIEDCVYRIAFDIFSAVARNIYF